MFHLICKFLSFSRELQSQPYVNKSVLEFGCTKTVQEVELKEGKYLFQLWGAQGGDALINNDKRIGGKGGYSKGILGLSRPRRFYIYVGEQGKNNYENDWAIVPGGWNSGGGCRRWQSSRYMNPCSSGGGSTDVSIIKSEMTYNEQYLTFERANESYLGRIIVAGSGGGYGINLKGLSGGGITGQGDLVHSNGKIEQHDNDNNEIPGPGTQDNSGDLCSYYRSISNQEANLTDHHLHSRPGSFGIGATYWSTRNDNTATGGGGAGWYGGGSVNHHGGAGGSGYVLHKKSFKPNGYLADDKDLYFSGFTLIKGNETMPSINGSSETGHNGDGFVRITSLNVSSSGFSPRIYGVKFHKKHFRGLFQLVSFLLDAEEITT